MSYSTLIDTDTVFKHLNDSSWRIIDCRYYLDKPQQGEAEFLQSHLPGALYAHLDKDLSATVIPGVTGRHPLPGVSTLCKLFSQWGVDDTVQVVVYDQGLGMIAARLWWMLRWLGHDAVAVMEGGWNKWLQEAKPVKQDTPLISPRQFTAKVHQELVASVEDVLDGTKDTDTAVIDARAADRYRGENETLDPVAGHIPHALSIPFMDHVDSNGCLRSAQELRALYAGVIGDRQAGNVIVYCGSGVTAALNILALTHAGLGMAKLYPGSWSHWVTDKNRPVATGG